MCAYGQSPLLVSTSDMTEYHSGWMSCPTRRVFPWRAPSDTAATGGAPSIDSTMGRPAPSIAYSVSCSYIQLYDEQVFDLLGRLRALDERRPLLGDPLGIGADQTRGRLDERRHGERRRAETALGNRREELG